MNNRVLTGKSNKLTREEREELVKAGQITRDKWENANIGNFEKIYPIDDPEEPYSEFISYAKELYEDYCGTSKKKHINTLPPTRPNTSARKIFDIHY